MSESEAQPFALPKYSLRIAAAEDKKELAAILADAFRNDPVVRWIIPNAAFDERFFLIDVADTYLPLKHCWIADQGSAAACWAPPDNKPGEVSTLALMAVFLPLLFKFGLAPMQRGKIVEQAFARLRPAEPHYYLHMLGARMANQGQGLGSALLKEGLLRADEHRMPAYLESSNIANVPLYERAGFRVKNVHQLGGDGPTVWTMWRDVPGS